MRKISFFAITLLSIGLHLFAQDFSSMKRGAMEAKLPTVVMPSPNSATITRQISENVDLYTGRLSLDLPLYSLKCKNIELPISVQTSVNAHKVDDIGSWVGLGWHLNAGGVITRVMKSLPDEFSMNLNQSPRNIHSTHFNFPGYGYLSLKTLSPNVVLDRFSTPLVPYTEYSISEMKDIIHYGCWNSTNNPPTKGYDLQPDEFYFNFGKFSGKFSFNQDGKIVFSTESNLFIIPTIADGKITNFIVKTDDGYEYEFGGYNLNAVEESKMKVKTKSMFLLYRYIGVFKNEVVNVNGNTSSDLLQYPTGFATGTGVGSDVPKTRYIYERNKPIVPSVEPPATCCYTAWYSFVPPQLWDFSLPQNTSEIEFPSFPSSWYLTKIKSPTGAIVTLNYESNGTLTYISNRTVSENNPTFDMPGDYYSGIGNPTQDGYSIETGIYNSYLQTQSGVVWDASLSIPKHVFPKLSSYSSLGERSISVNTMELQSKRLKEILSDDGTKIEFVANTLRTDLEGDKRLDKIRILKDNNLIKEFLFDYQYGYNTETFDPLTYTVNRPRHHYNAQGVYYGTSSEPYTVSEPADLPESVRNRLFLTAITEQNPGSNLQLPPFRFTYNAMADIPYRTSFKQDLYGYARDMSSSPPSFSKMMAGVLTSVTYPTGGTKEFTFEISGNTYSWNGLRIKEIKEKESATANPIVKSYTYGTYRHSDWAISSYVMPDDIFDNIVAPPKKVISSNKIFYSSDRINPEMQTRGAVGGYDFVEVSQSGNGKYRVEFYTTQDFGDNHTPTILVSNLFSNYKKNINDMNYWYPFPQLSSNDWKRGLPINEYFYKNDGKKVKSIHYDYELGSNANGGTGSSLGLQVTKYRIDYAEQWDWSWCMYGRYSISPRWQMIKSRTERDYHSDGITYLEKKTELAYNKIVYNDKELLFQSQVKQVGNSKGEDVIQRLKYPLDYSASSDAFGQGISFLKSKNVLSAVVEKYQYIQEPSGINKRYTDGVLNKFHTDKPLVKQTYIFQPENTTSVFTESGVTNGSFVYDAAYKPALNFNTYDTYGNIQEQNEESDAKEAYIWDYNKTHPVAKVSNASLNDVAYASFEADGTGNWIYNQSYVKQEEKGMTGKKYFEIPVSDKISSATLSPTQKYRVTFWCKYADPIILKYVNGGGTQIITPTYSFDNNGWKFYDVTVENVTKIEIAKYANVPKVIIDEVRMFPQNSQMVTYTFDPLVGMTAQCDPNNRIVYYEYDGLQRLKLLRDQYGNVVKTYEYNYKQ
jgi:hypothetical protein